MISIFVNIETFNKKSPDLHRRGLPKQNKIESKLKKITLFIYI